MMKKLGFGLMRLPSTDANDPSKIDIEQVKQMVDAFLAAGFTYWRAVLNNLIYSVVPVVVGVITSASAAFAMTAGAVSAST